MTTPTPQTLPGISDEQIDAYLKAQRETVEEADRAWGRPNVGGLHTNTVREACRNGLKAAIAAQPEVAMVDGEGFMREWERFERQTPGEPRDDSDRLSPCPFCGSEAEGLTMPAEQEDVGAGAMFVQCTNSRCMASSALIYPLGDDPKPLLLERWNRRTTSAPTVQAGAPGSTDAERAEWLADKIVACGDYAKEAAYMLRRWPSATPPAAQEDPVAELFTLMSPYIRACVAFNHTPRDGIGAAEAEVTAAMEPLKTALDALVEERDRLWFELDGVNAMAKLERREPLSEGQIMKCIAEAGCYGNVKMSFESGPYSIDRPSSNASKFVLAIELAHGIGATQSTEGKAS